MEFKAAGLRNLTEGARRRCRLALSKKNNDGTEFGYLITLSTPFSIMEWSEESRQVTIPA